MPLDPSIILAGRPAQIQTPLQAQGEAAGVATQYQQLKNLAASEQVQQQQAQSLTLENQQRQIDLQNQQAINDAVSKNVQVDPQSGKAYIDHQGVVGALTQGGHGVAAMKYQQQATAVQEGLANLQQTQDKVNNDRIQHVASFAGAVEKAPPEARATVYAQALPLLFANGYAKPGDLPAQYDPSMDSSLAAMRDRALTADQQYQTKYGQERVDAAQDRARASEERAVTANEKANQETWKPNGTRNGNSVYFNPATGAEKVGGPLDLQAPAAGRGGNANSGQPTPGQAGVQDRFNTKEIDAARKQLDQIHAQRTALGAGLAVENGESYTDPKTGKSGGDMTDAIRAGLQQQYQNVTNQGKRIMSQFGGANSGGRIGTNEFNDQQPAAPQASTPAQAPAAPQTQQPATQLPDGGGKTLDKATAQQFLTAAGGDKIKARQLAKQSNWKF